MHLQDQIHWQRLHYIITSYALEGNDGESFRAQLQDLLEHYPQSWIEFSLIEVLVRHWHLPPLPRGLMFLQEAQYVLKQWRHNGEISQINSHQFQSITGLTPLAIMPLESQICEL